MSSRIPVPIVVAVMRQQSCFERLNRSIPVPFVVAVMRQQSCFEQLNRSIPVPIVVAMVRQQSCFERLNGGSMIPVPFGVYACISPLDSVITYRVNLRKHKGLKR